MTKKLIIRFVKFEKALAAQQLEIKGQFEASKHIILTKYGVDFSREAVYISPVNTKEMHAIGREYFKTNNERDEYLERVVKWISEEQFSGSGKLEIGKECEFSDDGGVWYLGHFGGNCARELGEPRFLAAGSDILVRFKNARSIAGCVRPKIDGDVYTWEMEVADER
jgi:hypothetical protein